MVCTQSVGGAAHEAGPEPGAAAVLPRLRAGGGVDGRARGVPGAAARRRRARRRRQRRAAHQETRGLR